MYSLNDIPEKPQQFYLQDEGLVNVRHVVNAPREQERRTMAQLLKHLSSFRPGGAYLFQEGMLSGIGEYLLSFQDVVESS